MAWAPEATPVSVPTGSQGLAGAKMAPAEAKPMVPQKAVVPVKPVTAVAPAAA